MSENGAYRRDILEFAENTYDTKPEYLWQKTPDTGVLRHSGNKKWYAAFMYVTADKLGINSKDKLDILLLKCEPLMMGSLLAEKFIFPGYHMNKKNWITILLDGSADKQLVFSLLQMSYAIIKGGKGGRKQRTLPKEWLIPVNPKLYDIEQEFADSEVITWHQSASFIVGDSVFIYMAAPISSVMYECEVVVVDISHINDGNPSKRKHMKIMLKHRFEEGELGLQRMRELGVYSVRGARGVPHALSVEIAKLTGV